MLDQPVYPKPLPMLFFNPDRIKITTFSLLCLFLTFAVSGQNEIPPRPNPPRLVNDFANMLSPSEAAALERKLVAYNDSTSTQIAIVSIPTLNGADRFDYSIRLAKEWGIGQENNDNGILLFISLQDRYIGFQTGYGTEGFLPDAMAKRIIENIIKPAFRANRYYEGLDKATDIVMQLGSGEYEAEPTRRSAKGGRSMFVILIALFIMMAIISASQDRKDDDDDEGGYWREGRYDKRRRSGWGGGWIFLPGGGRSHGGFGGFGGGNSGGGFGGFGGGDFGGGGAWGEW